MSRIHVVTQAIDQRLGHVRDHGQATDHIAVQGAISYAQLALVSGAENDGSELVGESHQQRTPGPGLYVFFGRVFLASGKNLLKSFLITLKDVCDAE